MNIYGIVRSTVVIDDLTHTCWGIVKVVRQNDKLVWRGLFIEELTENGWFHYWSNFYHKDVSLELFRKTFDFPYVGDTFFDARSGSPYSAALLPVDPTYIEDYYSGEPR